MPLVNALLHYGAELSDVQPLALLPTAYAIENGTGQSGISRVWGPSGSPSLILALCSQANVNPMRIIRVVGAIAD